MPQLLKWRKYELFFFFFFANFVEKQTIYFTTFSFLRRLRMNCFSIIFNSKTMFSSMHWIFLFIFMIHGLICIFDNMSFLKKRERCSRHLKNNTFSIVVRKVSFGLERWTLYVIIMGSWTSSWTSLLSNFTYSKEIMIVPPLMAVARITNSCKI